MASGIELTGWSGLPGQYHLTFTINGLSYVYETWDKLVLDDVRRMAVYRPGKALNLAKRCCILIAPRIISSSEMIQPELL